MCFATGAFEPFGSPEAFRFGGIVAINAPENAVLCTEVEEAVGHPIRRFCRFSIILSADALELLDSPITDPWNCHEELV